MGDIIVTFYDGQGGFGDIMFAAKAASMLKQQLIAEGRLTGEVYICSTGTPPALDRLRNGQPDLEFGINYIKASDLSRLSKAKQINATHIINGPTYAPGISVSGARKTVSSEYSFSLQGKFPSIDAFKKLGGTKQEEQLAEITEFERGRGDTYIKTGLAESIGEKGILISPELAELSMGDNLLNKPTVEAALVSRLSSKTKTFLFKGADLETYRGTTDFSVSPKESAPSEETPRAYTMI